MRPVVEPITVIYGSGAAQSLQAMTCELLETVQLADRIAPGSRICLKPNLVLASPAENGATTHPQIVEGAITYLRDHGHTSITIAEGSWVGDRTSRAFRTCGYSELSERLGVELLDTQKSSGSSRDAGGYRIAVCDVMDRFDVLIDLPVLKGHCQTAYTGALKNLKGCIPDAEKRRFHSLGLHEPIARLNTVLKQDFIIMDAICGDPTFEEGGDPSRMHRILFSDDPVLIDSYAVTLLGMLADEVPYIIRAAELGVGQLWDERGRLREINTQEAAGQRTFRKDPLLERLEAGIDQRDACSSCYANLIGALKEAQEIPEQLSYAIGRAFRSVSDDDRAQGCIGVETAPEHSADTYPAARRVSTGSGRSFANSRNTSGTR